LKKVVLIYILFLLGCGPSGPYEMNVDSSFTKDELKIIQASADDWFDAVDSEDGKIIFTGSFSSNKPFTIDQWDDDSGNIFKVYSSDPGYKDLKGRWGRLGTLAGFYGNGNIALIVDNAGSNLDNVTLHEMGHLFGLGHAETEIMNPGYNDEPCIGPDTLLNFCDENDCGDYAYVTCTE